jgi:hypothetical protein
MFLSQAVRQRLTLAGAMLLSGLAGSVLTGTAGADQGNMIAARQSLHSAYNYLQQATPDKGGHRSNAMSLIQQAIREVNMGINYANNHGGG